MAPSTLNTKWNASLYDDKHDFVFKYGEDLIDVLEPRRGEKILDLGCGTGYLTDKIADYGALVTGIDSSAEMIEKARHEYPRRSFHIKSATDFHFDEPFDAVFSNAVLHWIPEKEKVVRCIYQNLKEGGRLVMEMGGKKNVLNIINAIKNVLLQHGHDENAEINLWYFPSVGEYSTLLEQNGFRVIYAAHYDRSTLLKDNENGIKDWIKMFGNSFLKGLEAGETEEILDEVQNLLKPTNFIKNQWYADYKRLRIIAIKE